LLVKAAVEPGPVAQHG